MAKDFGPIDFDALEVEILILAKTPKNLSLTVTHLTKIGWPTHVIGNLSHAVEAIAEKRPDIVLISFNHPSNAVKRLPDLIAQTFNVITIGFVENTDPRSANRLQAAKVRYKIFGKPTGFNFERGIRRILSEKLNVKEDEKVIVMGGKRRSWKELTGTLTADMASGNLLFGKSFENTPVPAPEKDPNPDLVGMLKQSLFEGQSEEAVDSPTGTMQKAISSALTQICPQSSEAPTLKILTAQRMAVFPVDSPTTPGYLVTTLATPPNDDGGAFLRSVERPIQAAFLGTGKVGKLENGFWLDVPLVNFWNWAENSGTFQFSLNYFGQEMGITFLQTDKPMPKPEACDGGKMYKLKVADISTKEPVSFKAYLYFKKNEKYYLYLRNGRSLQEEQKNRLGESHVEELYLKAVDLENLRMFLAKSYLNEMLKGSQEAA